jgi:hypothetical protein
MSTHPKYTRTSVGLLPCEQKDVLLLWELFLGLRSAPNKEAQQRLQATVEKITGHPAPIPTSHLTGCDIYLGIDGDNS